MAMWMSHAMCCGKSSRSTANVASYRPWLFSRNLSSTPLSVTLPVQSSFLQELVPSFHGQRPRALDSENEFRRGTRYVVVYPTTYRTLQRSEEIKSNATTKETHSL